jgi:hypothetical protein
MENVIINSYQYTSFFDHYFSSDEEWLNKPEQPLLNYVIENIPEYVTTVINFGCANGRDFIPFQDKYNCIGFDLAHPSIIKWACKTDNLTYYQCSIEDYLDNFNHNNLDLSECLVYSCVTVMYLTHNNQNRFIQHLLDHNCKNIVLHEYPSDQIHDQGYFNPSKDIADVFTRKHFRPTVQKQPTGFLYLNK